MPLPSYVMSYGKNKLRPEFWFSIPKNRVDELFRFLNTWVPHLYGDLDEEQIKERGFELIQHDTDWVKGAQNKVNILGWIRAVDNFFFCANSHVSFAGWSNERWRRYFGANTRVLGGKLHVPNYFLSFSKMQIIYSILNTTINQYYQFFLFRNLSIQNKHNTAFRLLNLFSCFFFFHNYKEYTQSIY